jgi:hypothetical protein
MSNHPMNATPWLYSSRAGLLLASAVLASALGNHPAAHAKGARGFSALGEAREHSDSVGLSQEIGPAFARGEARAGWARTDPFTHGIERKLCAIKRAGSRP